MTLSKQLRVFLLYARSDKQAVHQLYNRMVKDGVKVWVDEKNILPGQDWAYEIRKTIQNSDMVIVCLSKQFNRQGGFRHEEVKIALEKAKALPAGGMFIIPARLEPCDLPEALRRWHCVDLFDSDGYKKLLETFKEYVRVH
jgi:hypothetical protein